jgi:ABC-type transport system involved in multi-copper enzyme maturation permease subunit
MSGEMLLRVGAVAMNTYREAVRARLLHGLLALAIGTCGYALVVGAYAIRNERKVVSDLGAASVSLYAIVVAIVLGATSLYRELELKTIFPMLARPIERWQYLVGKYVGTLLTLATFVALDVGLLLFALGAVGGSALEAALGLPLGLVALALVVGWKVPRTRTWLPIPLGVVLVAGGAWFARDLVGERAVVLGQALFTLLEASIIVAACLVFASFSSPFLTAIFTLGLVLIGRSAATLAELPAHLFGPVVHDIGELLSRVFPNLMVYVPPRLLLAGEAVGVSLAGYAGWAALQSLAWTLGLLTLASLIFRRRDFL